MKKYSLSLFVSIFVLSFLGFNTDIAIAAGAYYEPVYNPSCPINTTLRLGSTGAGVVCLQTTLGGLVADGKFGLRTKAAVMTFQTNHNLVVDGIFGPISRDALTNTQSLVISGVSGPQSLNVNQQGIWTVTASNRSGGNLSYHVDWGEGNSNPSSGASLNSLTQQTSTFTHTYPTSGIRTVTFEVTNASGLSAQTTLSVNVGSVTVSNVKVTSPNGGERLVQGTIHNITWTAPQYFRATYADIELVPYDYCPPGAGCVQFSRPIITIATNLSINQNLYSWYVGNYASYSGDTSPSIFNGQYTIRICETGTNNCDSSDSYFTIAN